MCQGRSTPYVGDGKPLTFNDRNRCNGYINPYGLGLMSLSPIIWKCHGSLDPGTYVIILLVERERNIQQTFQVPKMEIRNTHNISCMDTAYVRENPSPK